MSGGEVYSVSKMVAVSSEALSGMDAATPCEAGTRHQESARLDLVLEMY